MTSLATDIWARISPSQQQARESRAHAALMRKLMDHAIARYPNADYMQRRFGIPLAEAKAVRQGDIAKLDMQALRSLQEKFGV